MTTNRKSPERRTRAYGYTDPAVAKRYREARWSGYGSRDSYYSHLRSKEKQELPKEAK